MSANDYEILRHKQALEQTNEFSRLTFIIHWDDNDAATFYTDEISPEFINDDLALASIVKVRLDKDRIEHVKRIEVIRYNWRYEEWKRSCIMMRPLTDIPHYMKKQINTFDDNLFTIEDDDEHWTLPDRR